MLSRSSPTGYRLDSDSAVDSNKVIRNENSAKMELAIRPSYPSDSGTASSAYPGSEASVNLPITADRGGYNMYTYVLAIL